MMSLKKIIFPLICGIGLISSTFALSSIASKEAQFGDLFLESDALEYTEPTWFQPHSLETAPQNADYWIQQVLPFEQDRYEDLYMVMPQIGLVTPVVPIPKGSSDFANMVNGQEIGINKYLKGGIIEYVNSVEPGYRGKRVDFGHSNFFRSDDGRYKSIFASIMRLDPGDEIRYFQKNSSGGFDLHKYSITSSYNIDPQTGVSRLLRDGDGADALVFGCTHGLDGRWMLEATYIGEPKGKPVPYVDPYADLNASLRARIDRAVRHINWLRPNMKAYTIVQLVKVIDHLKNTRTLSSAEELVLGYMEDKLVRIYPSQ